jgi:hypothetical protein
MRPVLATFALTLTPASSSLSANSTALGLPWIAASTSAWRRCRGGSSPVRTAWLISAGVKLF